MPSLKTEGKINKVEEQSKLDGVMLLLLGEKWERAGVKRGRKASKGGLYYNGVSTLLCFLRHLSFLLLFLSFLLSLLSLLSFLLPLAVTSSRCKY